MAYWVLTNKEAPAYYGSGIIFPTLPAGQNLQPIQDVIDQVGDTATNPSNGESSSSPSPIDDGSTVVDTGTGTSQPPGQSVLPNPTINHVVNAAYFESAFVRQIVKYEGRPFVMGGMGFSYNVGIVPYSPYIVTGGFDCSGLGLRVVYDILGAKYRNWGWFPPKKSADQLAKNVGGNFTIRVTPGNYHPSDPVFIDWNTKPSMGSRAYDHMIYYLGNHRWIQASGSAAKVITINAQNPGIYKNQW
jgi:cell wall-associated NlpC family hydrolase